MHLTAVSPPLIDLNTSILIQFYSYYYMGTKQQDLYLYLYIIYVWSIFIEIKENIYICEDYKGQTKKIREKQRPIKIPTCLEMPKHFLSSSFPQERQSKHQKFSSQQNIHTHHRNTLSPLRIVPKEKGLGEARLRWSKSTDTCQNGAVEVLWRVLFLGSWAAVAEDNCPNENTEKENRHQRQISQYKPISHLCGVKIHTVQSLLGKPPQKIWWVHSTSWIYFTCSCCRLSLAFSSIKWATSSSNSLV